MKQPTLAAGSQHPYRMILASTSSRRRELLETLGVSFTVVAPDDGSTAQGVDETPLPGEAPTALVQRLSRLKAQAVLNNLAGLSPTGHDPELSTIIIAADTIVILEEKILGKPKNPAEAVQMLALLREQPHHVYSGLTIGHGSAGQGKWQYITRLHQSRVWMRPYTDREIATYVASGSPLDKAGAYGIQDSPFAPVAHLEGCFTSVMGLPLGEVGTILSELGLDLPKIDSICTQHTGVPCCQTGPELL